MFDIETMIKSKNLSFLVARTRLYIGRLVRRSVDYANWKRFYRIIKLLSFLISHQVLDVSFILKSTMGKST